MIFPPFSWEGRGKESDSWVMRQMAVTSAYRDTILELLSGVFVPIRKEVLDIELVGLPIGVHKYIGDRESPFYL